jgi:hypothetical protein
MQPPGCLPSQSLPTGNLPRETTNFLPLGEGDEPRSSRDPTLTLEPLGYPDLDDQLTRDPEALGFSIELLDHPRGEVGAALTRPIKRSSHICHICHI